MLPFKIFLRIYGESRDFEWMLESGQLLSGVASFEGLAVICFARGLQGERNWLQV